MGQNRTYRRLIHTDQLTVFQVVVQETDLMIHADENLTAVARELVLEQRRYLETHIAKHPDFATTLRPWHLSAPAPAMVAAMTRAAAETGVGPMAAVAGAVAQWVGRGLKAFSDEVIVENGGDTYIDTRRPVTVGIFAGDSALSLRFGLCIGRDHQPVAVCTSSGTVGHSLSRGRADAVCVVCKSAATADAAATALANRVHSADDIATAIESAKMIRGVEGLVVIVDGQIGFWGELELVALPEKRVEFSQ